MNARGVVEIIVVIVTNLSTPLALRPLMPAE
jgi:hypothetical protein